jgi:RHS repeat-associated protein
MHRTQPPAVQCRCHLGSTSVTLDANGNKIGEMKYYPFGETRSGTAPTDRRFTGQRQEDSSLGSLYDFNARFYSPVLGRFLSADTIVPSASDPQQLNRYAYGLNNPVKYLDPSGHIVACGVTAGGCDDPPRQPPIQPQPPDALDNAWNFATGSLKVAALPIVALLAPETIPAMFYGIGSYTMANGFVSSLTNHDIGHFFANWNLTDASLAGLGGVVAPGLTPFRIGVMSGGQSIASQILQGQPVDPNQVVMSFGMGWLSGHLGNQLPKVKSAMPQASQGTIDAFGPATIDSSLAILGAAVNNLSVDIEKSKLHKELTDTYSRLWLTGPTIAIDLDHPW